MRMLTLISCLPGEKRTAFIREAVEKEIKRRERKPRSDGK